MFIRYCILSLIVFSLAGCASTQDTSLSSLEVQVMDLEKKLDQKDSEIMNLKEEVRSLGNKVKTQGSKSTSGKSKYRQLKDIVRVSATAEQVQQALKAAGVYDGNVDGKIGDKTVQAIEDFQKQKGLEPDGVVGAKTWSELKVHLE